MINFDKYSNALCEILKQNFTIENIPDYLYEHVKNFSVPQLEEFFKSAYQDVEPKKLNDNQRFELTYMLKRGMTSVSFLNGVWNALGAPVAISLVEEYPTLDTTQTYSIEWLLNNDKGKIVFIDKINLKKQYFDTGFLPTEKTNFEFKFSGITDIAQIKNRTLFGSRETPSDSRYTLIISDTGELQFDIGKIRNFITFDINNFVNQDVTIKVENYEFFIKVGNDWIKPEIQKNTSTGRVIIEKLAFTPFTTTRTIPVGCLRTGDLLQSWSEFSFRSLSLVDGTNKAFYKGAYTESAKESIYETVKNQFIEIMGI